MKHLKMMSGLASGAAVALVAGSASAAAPPPLPSPDPDARPVPVPEPRDAPERTIVFQPGGIVQKLPQPTKVASRRDVARLRTVQGITLQWIGWDARGPVTVAPDRSGVWRVNGSQTDAAGGSLTVSGTIAEIGEGYFLLDGRITINGTPDRGRSCDASKLWRFAVTQNRSYYRLREFEWCDRLTDYIDIYFAPTLR